MWHSSRGIAVASLLSATALLAGCGQLGGSAGGGRQAVASFYPLAWTTEQVAGEAWTVDNLTQPGQEPHDLTLDVAQTAALERADLVVLLDGFQPAVDRTAETVETTVLDAAEAVDLLATSEHEHEDEHEDADPRGSRPSTAAPARPTG